MLHQIGSGALGPVFRAYQPEQDRLVAVKLFRLDLPPERAHQLVAELETLVAAELSHPGIAAPVGAGMTGVSAYLAQDFVAADSLDVIVRSGGSSSPADVSRVAAQLASALDFAAARDILHGALHPRDILMSSDDVRLTGIGVTRALEHVGMATPVRRPYSAPERAVHGPWDRRADVFSLAALVFELLYGRRVSGAGARAVISVSEVAGTDRTGLKRAFARALAEDPADRFDTAVAFADALQVALTESSPVLPPEAAPSRTKREAPREEFLLTTGDVEVQPAELLLPLGAPDFDISVPAADETPSPPHAPSAEDLPLRTPDVPQDDHPTLGPTRSFPERENEVPATAASPLFSARALESTRPAVWSLVLALVVGIAIGFGIAVVIIGRDRMPPAVQQAQLQPAPVVVSEPPIVPVTDASRPPAERAVAEAAKPSPSAPEAGTAAAPTPPAPSAPPIPVAPRAMPRVDTAAPGRIVVRSTPAGAQVFLDGRRAGVTPLTLREVSRGSHAVRVEHEGYVTAERRVAVGADDQPPSVVVDLARARVAAAPAAPPPPARNPAPAAPIRSGSLLVDSRPAGASVFVDGKLVGTTPLVLSVIDASEHAIHLELAGYRRWASSVRIAAGERNRVAASMEK